MRRPPILPLILGLSFWGCSDAVDPPADGTLAVSTATSGDDPDPDGFQLRIDGIDSLALLPSGTAELDLSPGRHTLQLLGVAEQCSVLPGTSVEVDITAGRTAPVTFQVSCPGTSIRVAVTTTGLDPDQDGYQLTIDGVDALALVPTGTAQVNVASGRHTLQLLGVAGHCSVAPGDSVEVDIAAGRTTPVAFQVSCPGTGARITTTTTGQEIDRDGYRVAVDDADRGAISANGTMLILLDPGSRTIALSGLAPNCTLDGPGSRTVTVEVAAVVSVGFAVTCTDTRPLLAFSRSGDIYVAHTDGSNLRQLTSDDWYDREVAWSPDGSRIAFSKVLATPGIAIYVMNADGTNPTRLTPEGIYSEAPTWSPDGSRIAFETRRDSTGYGGVNSWLDTEIYVMNADGSHPTRLTRNLGHEDWRPAWSPDGGRIAYLSDAAGYDHIFILNVDGTSPEQLTSGRHNDYDPAWSPDGSRIAFTRDADLFVMDADGTNLTQLTPADSELGGPSAPAWSPDGLTIAFTWIYDCTLDDYGDYSCRVGIWVIGADGGSMHELPLGNGSEFGPSWRP